MDDMQSYHLTAPLFIQQNQKPLHIAVPLLCPWFTTHLRAFCRPSLPVLLYCSSVTCYV
jgi:hypothetical protein